MKYHLKQAVSGEIPVFGYRHSFSFAANRTTAQSEQDEAVFEYLVSIGEAEYVPETAAEQAEETPTPAEPAPTGEET